ncbi:MAG: serine--tRNA ligase [Candidatus Cloacimonetes bacterium]|nr:serine--tRNA ligase [Candidatus Cloacimonadota bacterium]MCF7814822.1 serine--tRNA ligase [Candidatus Cloacimonadota bacterium]MCF7867648.1 serine--tRNA ligase [Candidatus Cloacimonadota bacterium]MCF7883554.1 serine--tRNA ligase [Candidatus Cloacimonadota bacterium]
MLDIKFVRENAELVKEAIQKKNEKADVDKILALDEKKRKIQFEFDTKRAEQNKVSKEIPKLKKAGEDITNVLKQMKGLAEIVKNLSAELSDISKELEQALLTIPNIPNPDVPTGGEENNEFVKDWGEKKEFTFKPKDHLELAEINDLLIMKRAAKISGSGFVGYKSKGARLERALINFMLDYHIQKNGYEEVMLPILVNRETMTGTGQLPKLEDDMYHVDLDDLFLIPTAEVSVTNLFSDEIMNRIDLPEKLVSYSPCFRREAGSYGKDTKGLQRLHQFNKVEMVRFTTPEESNIALEEMLIDAENILQALGLHYRVVTLATGDLSFASAKTYDLEVWAPGAGKYLEVSSVSNFEDFQARRASIRFRDEEGKVKFVHTLNGSGLATPRTVIALLETYQNEDGTVDLPKALKPYFAGSEKI